MKEIIYAEEFGMGLQVEGHGRTLRVAIIRYGNSPGEAEEVASATIADYRVKNQLLPVIESLVVAPQ